MHHPLGLDAVDVAWTFRTAPARSGALFVLCASMLVSLNVGKPKRAETARNARHRAAPRKPAGDFLVQGTVVPPPDQSDRRGLRVAIALDGWRKELVIFGDRRWRMGPLGLAASEPEPFTSIPITWDRAFGGTGEARNPIGCGFGPGERGRMLPNVEYLDRRVTQPTSRPEPAGFGPLDSQWQPRLGKLGTFDDAWLADNWPLMPDDFDPTYWNEAPPDQQFPGFFRGDERLAFENMRTASPRLDVKLPGIRARAFGQMINGRYGEIRLTLDTIDVDLDAGQAELIWRGSFPVRSPRFKEIDFLFTLCENLDDPSDEQAWRSLFETARRARYPTPEERAADAQAQAAASDAKNADRKARFDTMRAEASAAAKDAEARYAAAASTSPDPTTPDPTTQRAAIVAAFTRAGEQSPKDAVTFNKSLATVLAAHDRRAKRNEIWTRERVVAAHQANVDLSEADLSGLDLSGLTFVGTRIHRAKFVEAHLTGCTWRDADLSGCDFTQALATNADFTNSIVTDTRFRKADLTGALFIAADLTRANFTEALGIGATFDGAHGVNPRFDSAELQDADFRNTKLARASFAKARLDRASFDGAKLIKADFACSAGQQVSFCGADITNLRGRKASLPGARFSNALGTRSVWLMACLTDAEFSGAVLTRANFAEASLERAIFDRAVLVDAGFDDAMMKFCILTNANLLRASFARADLRDGDLRGANLYRAGLFGARANRARLDGSFLAGTLLTT